MTGAGTFRFENVEHPWLWLIGIGLGALLFSQTYRGIFLRTERRLTWWLMGLRGIGLVALLLALARPTWIRETQHVDPGRVAVILDDSLSMSLADPSGQSRYALGVKAVTELTNAINRPSAGPRIEVDLFDINGSPVAGAPPAEPRAERTDLVRAVSQTTSRLRSKALVGLVLVTDGVDNTGRGDLLALADTPAPVYAVGFREDTAAAQLDLSIENVQAPKRVILNNDVKVDIQIAKRAGPAVDATVAIKRGRDEVARQGISLREGAARERISLTFAPAEAGSFVYTASVETPVGEQLLANNAGHFPLQVEAEPIRVFYVEGFLRHEYKFLKNRLEDDPDVGLVSVVRRGKPESLQAGAGGQLITTARLDNLDIMILGDMEADYLAESEYKAIVDWVDQGHALLVLGGYRSFGLGGFQATPLADVLPVVFRASEPFQSEGPFVPRLTEAGLRHPIFEVTGDRVKDEAMWNASPPLLGCGLVARAKQGAEVLAVNPVAGADDGPAPIVVIQRYGAGTVMLLAVDTTWRWSRLTRVLNQSDTLFGRFWGQTVRWLSGRDEEAERPLIAVSTDQPDYEVGKPVTIRVSRLPQPGGDAVSGEVSVELLNEAGDSVPLETAASTLEPDTFTGVYYPSAGGRYEAAAALIVDGQPIANQSTEFLVHGPDLELADTRTNRPQLQAIANATGGVYVDVEEAASLAGRIERRERRTPLIERNEFWNSPILFLVFLAAITAEWVVRRRNHLA